MTVNILCGDSLMLTCKTVANLNCVQYHLLIYCHCLTCTSFVFKTVTVQVHKLCLNGLGCNEFYYVLGLLARDDSCGKSTKMLECSLQNSRLLKVGLLEKSEL